MWSLLMPLVLAASPADACQRHPHGRAAAAGVAVAWRHKDGHLEVEMTAPTTGWVTVGFSEQPGLAGTHLVMGAVEGDGAVVLEHHRAEPPAHAPVPGAWAELVEGDEVGGVTRVRFRVPASAADRPSFAPGAPIHLTLAWSRSDELAHHSAQRAEVEVVL